MIGRKLRNKLDLLNPQQYLQQNKNFVSRKIKNSQNAQRKYYKDERNKMFQVDEYVLVKDYRGLKTNWIRGIVKKKIGPRLI